MPDHKRTARAPRRPAYSGLVDDLLAATATTAATAVTLKATFPTLTEFDEFGFDTTTGEAGFDTDDPIRIALPPGRPPKSR